MNFLIILLGYFIGYLIPNVIFLKSDVKKLNDEVNYLKSDNRFLRYDNQYLKDKINKLEGDDN